MIQGVGLLVVGEGLLLGAVLGVCVSFLTQYMAYCLECCTVPIFAYGKGTADWDALSAREQDALKVKKPTRLSFSTRDVSIIIFASLATALAVLCVASSLEGGQHTALLMAPQLWGSVFLTVSLLALSVMDIEYRILPDWIVFPCLWVGVLLNVYQVFVPIWQSVWGVILGYGVLWVVSVVFQYCKGHPGIGQGDMKLVGMLCAWLGVLALPNLLLFAGLLGLCSSLLMRLSASSDMWGEVYPIPFGLYLSVAGWGILLYHLTFPVVYRV